MPIDIRQQLVPAANRKVLSGVNPINSITVHQTGNPNRGANAAAHANLQSRGNPGRNASWQYQNDDGEAVQSYRDSDCCMHAGDGARGTGNTTSIAVEICINSDGDYKKSVENGARLVAVLVKRHGLSINNVVQHRNWSGKNCPAQIRAGKDGITWAKFLDLVRKHLGQVSDTTPIPDPTPAPTPGKKSVETLAREVMSGTWGNNPQRRQRLQAAGYDPAAVQRRVNALVGGAADLTKETEEREDVAQMAAEILAGKHGNGHANRQKSLGVSNAIYAKVRAEVNRRAGGGNATTAPKPAAKSITEMALEVLAGTHGNGHANRRKSLGVTNTVYQQVRAEVNRRTL